MTTNEQITQATYNKIAEVYSKHTTDTQPHIRELLDTDLESTINLFGLDDKVKKVLIVGAGDGRDGILFNENGFHAICIDYSSSMKELAIKNGFPENDYTHCDVRDYKFNTDFSIIWASTCLYHIRKEDVKRIVFPSLYQSLTENGVLYVNLFLGVGEVMEEMPETYGVEGSRFYVYYQKQEILDIMNHAGFNIFETVECDIFGKQFIRIFARRQQ